MGKRGGVRAVYSYRTSTGIVYMLDIYAKNEKVDLTPADKLTGPMREVHALEIRSTSPRGPRRTIAHSSGVRESVRDEPAIAAGMGTGAAATECRRSPYLQVIERNPKAVQLALKPTAA